MINVRMRPTRSLGYLLVFLYLKLIQGQNLPECGRDVTTRVKFPEEERKSVLDLHNELRAKIYNGQVEGLPQAKRMENLTWDPQLEDEAIRWLELCPDISKGFDHPSQQWKLFPYSQNMAWGYKTYESAIMTWFNEYKEYVEYGVDPLIYRPKYNPVRLSLGLGQIGHFTAMVSASSNKIGCSKVVGDKLPHRVIYCCNYSPPGNIVLVGPNGVRKFVPAYETDSYPDQTASTTQVSTMETRRAFHHFRRHRSRKNKSQGPKTELEIIPPKYRRNSANLISLSYFKSASSLDTTRSHTVTTTTTATTQATTTPATKSEGIGAVKTSQRISSFGKPLRNEQVEEQDANAHLETSWLIQSGQNTLLKKQNVHEKNYSSSSDNVIKLTIHVNVSASNDDDDGIM